MDSSATKARADSSDSIESSLDDTSINGLRRQLDAIESEIQTQRDEEPNARLAGVLAFADDSITEAQNRLESYQEAADD